MLMPCRLVTRNNNRRVRTRARANKHNDDEELDAGFEKLERAYSRRTKNNRELLREADLVQR